MNNAEFKEKMLGKMNAALIALGAILGAILMSCGIETETTESSIVISDYVARLNPLLAECLSIEKVQVPAWQTYLTDYKPSGGGASYQAPDTIRVWEGVKTFHAFFGHEYVRHVLFHQDDPLWKPLIKHSSYDWSPPGLNCMWNAAEDLSREYD